MLGVSCTDNRGDGEQHIISSNCGKKGSEVGGRDIGGGWRREEDIKERRGGEPHFPGWRRRRERYNTEEDEKEEEEIWGKGERGGQYVS